VFGSVPLLLVGSRPVVSFGTSEDGSLFSTAVLLWLFRLQKTTLVLI
jgi:hypothetical protein